MFRVGLRGCGAGIEFAGDEVDHRDVVTVGAIAAVALEPVHRDVRSEQTGVLS